MVARSSGGQVFRGEIPGNLVGNVSYSFTSSDDHGNTGASAASAYTATTALTFANVFGTGTNGSLGEPTIAALSVPFAGADLYLNTGNVPAGTPFILFIGDVGLPVPFTLGNYVTLNVAGNTLLLTQGLADSEGNGLVRIPVGPGTTPGFHAYAQFFTQKGTTQIFASSKGLELISQ